ncbi:redoxin family protein [Streptomyces sp. HNM0575]|uniref:redoxin family protein n=1 Tax=Streptomyces sp. HNM0575 TaxID=2716338 RepID=UPI00145ECEA2|nr:redoxin family protein [Streptomyces sp. HNM0575]NLU72952.1 redoxin family protein [Streptomyces sp. HNM0575]
MRAGRTRTRTALTALLVAGALSVAGCGMNEEPEPAGKSATDKDQGKETGSGKGEEKGGGKDTGKEEGGSAGIAPGEKAPDGKAVAAKLKFASTTLDGKSFKGESLAGKPSVLWFWAPWCGTCQGQASTTAKLAAKYKGKVNFVGVAGLDKTEPIRGFVKTQKVGNFPHLNDQKGSVWKKFGISQQSSYVMLDKNGRTVHEGAATSPDQLTKQVAGLAG